MKFANDPLWQKINSFPIDDPASFFPFPRKLAQENNWDQDFTQRAIREYKRFIYLCCVLHEGASPPPIIDKVWHLHMLYSVNYWEEFCDKTLGRKLHHNPSKGGPAEKEKHVNWLAATIENYRFIFEEGPPDDIWLTAGKELYPKPIESPTDWSRTLIRWISPVLFFSIAILAYSHGAQAMGILLAFLGLIFFILAGVAIDVSRTPATGRRNDSDTSTGSGCSSGDGGGGDSSCSGGDGGGCGGCGGGD